MLKFLGFFNFYVIKLNCIRLNIVRYVVDMRWGKKMFFKVEYNR